ncbi:MAG: DUF885 domain-containing protein, partial [Pseudomonadota bacterium]|nr:DUF885 domain-containing protein [Pseudomonadota bacterium]
MRKLPLALIGTASVALASPAFAAPAGDFNQLMNDYWAAMLKESPLLATSAGVDTYDSQLDELSLEAMDRRTAQAQAFLNRLNAIPVASLPAADQANHSILKRSLQEAVEYNRFGARQMLYGTLGSYHDYYAGIGETQPFRTKADYENYLSRIALVPDRMRNYGEISVKAASEGYVQPCVTLTGFPATISGNISADPAKSRFYAPFAGTKPAALSQVEWDSLKGRATALIRDKINPSYQAFGGLYDTQLASKCRQDVSVSALPQGKEYYSYLIRNYTTTDMTAEQIHALGLSEVARIRAEMGQVAAKAGFASREAMIADMRTNAKYYVKTPEELLEATSLQAKIIDGKMPSLFNRLPRLPYGIRPMAAATAPGDTTARYQPGSPDAGLAGFYLVNTTKLDQRPLWEIPALTVHEAVPGHHMQIATQQELEMPAWRKYGTFFTAFVEGWGLYS